MRKFFIVKNITPAVIMAGMWAVLAIANVILDGNFLIAFYQFNLMLVWALVYSLERGSVDKTEKKVSE